MTTIERLFARTLMRSDGCMEWSGPLNRGYGQVRVHGKGIRVHRLAYELARGPIGDGFVIDHLCRNRACINPWHLEATTQAVNVRRGDCGGSVRPDGSFVCKRCGGADAGVYTGRGHGGKAMRCKACDAARYEANKERVLAKQKARYAAKRDEINAKQRAKWAARKEAANG